jgi:hypothetical protein
MKHAIQKLTLAFGVLLLAAVPFNAEAKPLQSGIQGRIFTYSSYGTPVEVEPGVFIGILGVQLPVAATFSVVSVRNGREVARGASGSDGLFSVALPPGKYLLVPDDLIVNRFFNWVAEAPAPIEVTVRARQFTTQNVFYLFNGFMIQTTTQ